MRTPTVNNGRNTHWSSDSVAVQADKASLWFSKTELQFASCNITAELSKYNHSVFAFLQYYGNGISEWFLPRCFIPTENPYSALKVNISLHCSLIQRSEKKITQQLDSLIDQQMDSQQAIQLDSPQSDHLNPQQADQLDPHQAVQMVQMEPQHAVQLNPQ